MNTEGIRNVQSIRSIRKHSARVGRSTTKLPSFLRTHPRLCSRSPISWRGLDHKTRIGTYCSSRRHPAQRNKASHSRKKPLCSVIYSNKHTELVQWFHPDPQDSRHATRASIVEAYEKAFNTLIDILRELPTEAWHKGTTYPRQYRTVEQMAHRPTEHFEEHAARLCCLLNIDLKGNQHFIEEQGV
jgi:hypothetical protein